MTNRRVMIATPTKSGDVTIYYALALAETVMHATKAGIDIEPMFIPHDSFIHHARNRLLKLMLERGFTDIIFADADNDWRPSWVLDLLNYPVDVVGGTYPRKQDETYFEVRIKSKPMSPGPDGLWEVDGLGAGFVRLSRKAVLALWNWAPSYRYRGETHRMMCNVTVINGELYGEDTTLYENLATLGFKVYLDPTMSCGHTGTKRWKLPATPWRKSTGLMPGDDPPVPDYLKLLP